MNELTEFEKLVQGVNQLAILIFEYCKALESNGFSHEDAMLLSVQYQKEIVWMAKSSRNNDEGTA